MSRRRCDNTVSSFINGLSHIQKGCTLQIDLHLEKSKEYEIFPPYKLFMIVLFMILNILPKNNQKHLCI